jgi:hypothetical protein
MAATINTATQVLVLQTDITNDGAAVYTQTVTRSLRIFNATVTKTAAAAGAVNQVQLQTAGFVAITDLMGGNIAQNATDSADTIDDATNVIAANGSLVYAVSGLAGNRAYTATVYCIPA